MKKQILVVGDNDLNRALLCGILSDSYRVPEAGNGQEALDILRQHKDSLIKLRENAAMVNHLQYDRLTGLYSKDFFFSKVRERLPEDPEQDYCKQVPIVAMTANAFAEDVHAAKTAGMNEHIAKPLDIAALANTLRRWLL